MGAVEPDFWGASAHTAYPFVGPYDLTTAAAIDAAVSVAGAYQGLPVKLTYLLIDPAGSPKLELACGSTVLIPRTAAVVSTPWGAYDVLTAATDEAAVTLVVDRTAVLYDGSGYEFVPHVVSYAGVGVESVAAESSELAGPGQAAYVVPGSNVQLAVSHAFTQSPVVTVSAAYVPEDACSPTVVRLRRAIKTINGAGGDATRDFRLRGKGTVLVNNGSGSVSLQNVGRPCCDCADYVEVFERLRQSHARLATVRGLYDEMVGAYKKLLNYVKFLLRSPIVGTVDPNDGADHIAMCED